MKLIWKSYFVIIALICFSATAFAEKGPPAPTPQGAPGPPGFPIDNNIYILVSFATAFGLYKVYQFKKHKKTPN